MPTFNSMIEAASGLGKVRDIAGLKGWLGVASKAGLSWSRTAGLAGLGYAGYVGLHDPDSRLGSMVRYGALTGGLYAGYKNWSSISRFLGRAGAAEATAAVEAANPSMRVARLVAASGRTGTAPIGTLSLRPIAGQRILPGMTTRSRITRGIRIR
jgi:hypothetical protein